jgi:RHS repeat-associated protein
MCPGIAVLGGGGSGGDGDGSGSGGQDGSGGGGSGSGEGGAGDGKNAQGAPDYAKYPECGYASHPVDVVTGRAFTHPITELALPGPLPLEFRRMYSSKMADRDVGLGYGWGHTFGWEIEVARRRIRVWNEQGIAVDFPMIAAGDEVVGPWGWLLRRDGDGFSLDVNDGVWRRFSAADDRGKRYRLAFVEDRNRNRIALTYERGRLVQIVDSAGRVVRVGATTEGRIASLEVKNAVAQGSWVPFAIYTYDDRGNLAAARDADGFSSRYAYDEDHRMTEDTDRTGLTFHFVYDREGRCVESWGDYPGKVDPSLVADVPKRLADGVTRVKGIHHCRFDYMPNGYSEVADSTQVRRFFGNRHGTLDKRIEGTGVTTATYRDDGHIMSRTDPMGAVTTFERDARGRIVKTTDPLGGVTAVEYDGNGLPVAVTDPAGGVTRIERDPRGNILSTADAAGGVTSYRRDERGLMTETISPSGARRAYAYDAHGNVIAVTEPNGGVLRFTYDALSRLLARRDPLGAETRYTYSLRGDLTGVRDELGGVTRYTYDGEGHLTHIVDPKGRTTELKWGGYHKLCSRKDANGNEVRLCYDLEGQLVEVHNERGEVHWLTYGTSGLLIGEATFDGRELRYRHDLAGRVTRVTNGLGQVTDITYDLVGRVVKREVDDGSTEEIAYDARGDLIAAKGPHGEIRLERDAVGRVVRDVQIVGGKEHWIEIAYDAAGDRVARKTSLGHAEAITRGVLGERVRTVLDERHVVEHRSDLLGREIARALPGGGWIQSVYDALGRVSRRRAGRAHTHRTVTASEPEWVGAQDDRSTVDTAYRYDWDGQLIESADRARGRTRYEYDPVGQLLASISEKARGEVFRYDPAGNLHEDAAKREYGKGGRLLYKGDTSYRWDGDGRLIEKRTGDEVVRYAWDSAGLLRCVEGPDGARVDLVYDVIGRRVEKRVTRRSPETSERVPVSVTRFVWDGDVLVHEIKVAARQAGDPVVEERTYIFEDDGFAPIAHAEGGAWLHYVNDPIGTPERLVEQNGHVAGEFRRETWGEVERDDLAKARTPLRFPGQYEDDETGLCCQRFRYYDPDAGRFISPDPLGLEGGFSAYRYAPNPKIWIDPLGLEVRNVDPRTINYSQRTCGPETLDYQRDMRNRRWDWDQSGPLRCMEVNGQLVSYDNRRLRAAQNATGQQPTVPVEIVDPNARGPGGMTWGEAFAARRCDPRNVAAGGAVPPDGVQQQPRIVRPPPPPPRRR